MIPATTLHATLRGMAAVGLDVRAIADAAGVPGWDQAPPSDPYAVARPDTFGRVWGAAFQARPAPELPALVGAAVPFGAFGLTDHLVGSAPTLGDGLRALAQHARLVASSSTLDAEPPWLWVETGPATGGPVAWTHPRAVGDLFTIAVVASRFEARVDGRPDRVELVHDGPGPGVFESALGAPVQIGCARSGVALPAGSWSEPLRRADPSLHGTLAALAESSAVRSYAERPLAHAVRSRIPEVLEAGACSARDLADALGLSLRTFQRRLVGEGTSFAAVLEAYRRDESVRLLDGGAPVGEVAAQLGYAEPTSLTRAFRRWHGRPPSHR